MDNCTHIGLQSTQHILAPRGFVTIATGSDKYYKMALNLLHSYQLNGNSNLPFALICDKDCDISREFDHVVIIPNPHNSFLDKLSLYDTTPYQETIFIDADSLVLQDTNPLWDDFAQSDDLSCYGRELPLESLDGWFYYEGMKDLKSQLKFNISMHGGLYYLRKTSRCQAIFDKAIELVDHYRDYSFYYFNEPADEPLLALSMALSDCKPCPKPMRVVFYITHKEQIRISPSGKMNLYKKSCNPMILHFGTRNIPRFLYQYSVALVDQKLQNCPDSFKLDIYLSVWSKCIPYEIKYHAKTILKKLLPYKAILILKKAIKRQ